jgi:hypothetical protein
MRPVLTSALLFACAIAGPLDRGSISPGGGLSLTGAWDMTGNRAAATAGISPGLEYAVARGCFVGGSISLVGSYGTDYSYTAVGLGPVARLFLSTDDPCLFLRFEPSTSMTNLSGGTTGLGVCVAGSVGLLTMLSHGVALEPALFAQWNMVQTRGFEGWIQNDYSLSAGIGVGLRSYIYK